MMNEKTYCTRYVLSEIQPFRWLVCATVIVFLNGCASNLQKNQIAVHGEKDTPSPTESTLEIKVFPRIGLFNDAVYNPDAPIAPKNPRDSRGKINLSKSDYLNRIDDGLKNLFPGKKHDEWDMLTTRGISATSYDMAQFKKRRVQVSFQSKESSNPILRCSFKLEGQADEFKEVGFSTDSCTHMFEGLSNAKQEVQVAVTYKNQTTDTFVGDIPEDFSVVIIGDSYASGEGNPDHENGNGFFRNLTDTALWMDERCHRSAWAAPIRAGLDLAKNTNISFHKETANSKREYTVSQSGAFTIASLACSGAMVENGILKNYGGTLSRAAFDARIAPDEKIEEKDIVSYLKEAKARVDTDLLWPQIDLIDNLLIKEAGEPKIGMLIVSAGGNDVLFSPLVNILLSNKDTKNSWVPYYKDQILSVLDSRYHDFANKISNEKVEQVVFIKYPDPTEKSTTKNIFCSGPPSNGPLNFLFNIFGKTFEESTSASASINVVGELNKKIASVSHNNSWYVVDVSDQFRGHGWCANDSWFRDVDASLFRQHDILGTFHPNGDGHEMIAGNIELAMDKTLDIEFYPSTNEGHLYPANAGGSETKFFKPPLKILTKATGDVEFPHSENDASKKVNGEFSYVNHAKCSDEPGKKMISCTVACNDDPSSLSPKCSEVVNYQTDINHQPKGCGNTATGCKLEEFNDGEKFKDGEKLNITLKTHHPFTKRLLEHTLNNFTVDMAGPVVKCSWGNCNEVKWLNKETMGVSSISASDNGSGCKQIEIDGASTDSADCKIELSDKFLHDGTTELNVEAVDNVSNVNNPENKKVTVRLDTEEPSFESISIYGVKFDASSSPIIPSGKNFGIEIFGTDITSGIGDISLSKPNCIASQNSLIDTHFQQRWSQCSFENDFEVIATDKAGNSKRQNILVVDVTHVKRSKEKKLRPLPVFVWKKRFSEIDAKLSVENEALFNKVKLLSERFRQTTPDSISNDDWLLLAGWLNLVDGRLNAAKAASRIVTFDCSLFSKQGATAFATLKNFDSSGCGNFLRDAGRKISLSKFLIKEGIIGVHM